MNELERIEMLADEKIITNPTRIRDVLNKLLNLRYRELVGEAQCQKDFILKEIATGFELDIDRVKTCSVKEILTLISLEPGIKDNDYFELHKEPMLSKLPETALHSFLMCPAFTVFGRNNPKVKKFLKIDFNALVNALLEQNTSHKAIEFLNSARNSVMSYVSVPEHGSILVGDVLSEIFNNGTRSWNCGIKELNDYTNDIHKAYSMANTMIMGVIKNFMITTDAAQVRGLLDSCSTNGRYEGCELDYRLCCPSVDY